MRMIDFFSGVPSAKPFEAWVSALALMAAASAMPAVAQPTEQARPEGTAAPQAPEVIRASSPATQAMRELPLWEAGMGLSGLYLPHYRGSDQTRSWFLPLPYIVYRGEWFKADREGARALLVKGNRVQVDLSVAGSAPASSENNSAREGMPDLKGTVELGPNVNMQLWREGESRVAFRLPLRAAFTLGGKPRHVGFGASPYVTWETRSASAWDVGLRLGALFADRRLNAYTYDVAPEYRKPGREAFRSGGGFAGLQATVGASKRMGNWWVGAFARADSLAGAVFEDSSLVRKRQHLTAGLAVSYIFASSSTMVLVRE